MEVQNAKNSVAEILMKHYASLFNEDIPKTDSKVSKPITEKRRKNRINKCLVQLKNIVMRAKGKDEKRFAKMEKVDKLKMTIGSLG